MSSGAQKGLGRQQGPGTEPQFGDGESPAELLWSWKVSAAVGWKFGQLRRQMLNFQRFKTFWESYRGALPPFAASQ